MNIGSLDLSARTRRGRASVHACVVCANIWAANDRSSTLTLISMTSLTGWSVIKRNLRFKVFVFGFSAVALHVRSAFIPLWWTNVPEASFAQPLVVPSSFIRKSAGVVVQGDCWASMSFHSKVGHQSLRLWLKRPLHWMWSWPAWQLKGWLIVMDGGKEGDRQF